MILTGQHSSQSDPAVLDALLWNVGTVVCFRLGASDAQLFAKQLTTPEIVPRDLINLPNYEMVVRLMVDGEKTKGFSSRTSIPASFCQLDSV